MKKLISILLITVFFTAQYARQLAYLECKLVELSASAAVSCDCEKITDINKAADDGVPASKSHTHIIMDEFFSNPAGEEDNRTGFSLPGKPVVHYEETMLNGISNTPYRPPGA